MATEYAFVTKWEIKAPLKDVWDSIYSSLDWPTWWKGVLKVKELETGDQNGIGGVREYKWKSILPYKLAFNMRLIEVENFKRLKGVAFGELEGIGEWKFEQKGEVTCIEYHWTVITNKAWMNYLSFLLKPAFNYNHDMVMRWGADGLSKKLGAPLLSKK